MLSRFGAENGEIATWDDFARYLRQHLNAGITKGKGKRKADEMENGDGEGNAATCVVVILTHAEKLRTVLGQGWAVMTRLAELVGLERRGVEEVLIVDRNGCQSRSMLCVALGGDEAAKGRRSRASARIHSGANERRSIHSLFECTRQYSS